MASDLFMLSALTFYIIELPGMRGWGQFSLHKIMQFDNVQEAILIKECLAESVLYRVWVNDNWIMCWSHIEVVTTDSL